MIPPVFNPPLCVRTGDSRRGDQQAAARQQPDPSGQQVCHHRSGARQRQALQVGIAPPHNASL